MSTIILSEQINLSSNSAFVKNGSYNSAMIFNLPIMKREQIFYIMKYQLYMRNFQFLII